MRPRGRQKAAPARGRQCTASAGGGPAAAHAGWDATAGAPASTGRRTGRALGVRRCVVRLAGGVLGAGGRGMGRGCSCESRLGSQWGRGGRGDCRYVGQARRLRRLLEGAARVGGRGDGGTARAGGAGGRAFRARSKRAARAARRPTWPRPRGAHPESVARTRHCRLILHPPYCAPLPRRAPLAARRLPPHRPAPHRAPRRPRAGAIGCARCL
jgi:hypothetical protein